ncbi:MAG TPA: VWA domain-containing protein [Candidatus Acidoferrum sp.]|nr:VWA domain-containing protein [Candidatus Acidoferrum sp.]
MTFGVPQWLWGLLLIPLLIALFVRSEQRGLKRLQEFVSARLLPQLAGTVNRPRRMIRFALHLLGLALAIVSLAQPRWGYTFEDVKRKGLDLLIAVDTSRSMLSNDVQPNRLDRVKLAIQDLIGQLQGDRVGLIAFAGRAFLQAPLTIDYDAVVEALSDLDTKTIPEGGTNISSAITLATQSFGKSAMGNRALVVFTDGEELSGDAVKTAKEAADAGVRIFTVGVGTPQGSLIPVTGDDGQTSFVKDSSGQVVKSKLDDKRLREIAQATGGFYLHLENGPRSMQQIQNEGLAKMQAAEMDVRLSRRPIERYEWSLGAALIALALSILIPERKRTRERASAPAPVGKTVHGVAGGPVGATAAAALLMMFLSSSVFATAAPGLDAYRSGKFEDAYGQFQQTIKTHPESRAEDKLQFDSGAAAYKLKDYSKAMESFSQALLSRDIGLQSKGHYNLGNTLYQRGEAQKSDDKKLSDWTNALDHYEQTLKLNPQNKEAKDNYDYVKKKIEELKNKKQDQPSPSPSPQQKNEQSKQNKQDKQDKQQQQNQQNQQQKEKQQQQENQQQQQGQGQQQQQQKDQKQDQDQQPQGQSGNQKDQQPKNEPQKSQQQQKPGETPSPSPGADKQQGQQPSPSPGEQRNQESPSPGEGQNESPSPSPGEGEGENGTPSPTPGESKKFAGEVKGSGEDKSQKPPDKNAQVAEGEPEKEGQMSQRQAEALLESMKDEEARVQLDERRATRRVYKDW